MTKLSYDMPDEKFNEEQNKRVAIAKRIFAGAMSLLLLFPLLALLSSFAHARGYETYDPSTGQTVYIQQQCCEPVQYKRVNVD